MKKCILIFIGVFALTFNTKAQEGFEAILLADAADSKKLMQSYFAPGMEGFINAMNNGWYHTAKVHKPFGFDLAIGLSGAMIPTEKELFNISALGLTSITSSATTASTFAGPSNTTSMTVNTTINGQNVTATFDSPGGILSDLPAKAVPAPIVQLSVGLPWKLEGMLRFVPELSIGEDDGKVKMLGLGVKKEITDWFGPMEKTPLHVSLLAAYTTMDVSYGIADQNSGEIQVQNALTEFNLKAFTVQAIASLNFPIINIYGGIGYNSGSSSYAMSGTFIGEFTDTTSGQKVTKNLSVPTDLEFDSSGFATTVGARLSLGFFKIFASYALQDYNTFSAGVALSIR
ncbi:DUF6588 family protein [Polaribacter sp. Hel1_85]|uniref:DUF6588 family protein n=1 Tax=Polaribacter sp. Hel1_85 TaxID=1250005 RepID=UPI00052D1464|nr:DUF6588 family protein [Polaribacter sp. Hel1_85]KGL58518.1 hypothetical protein PHEL85_2782 [Polaribacter sp. Hel1_85]